VRKQFRNTIPLLSRFAKEVIAIFVRLGFFSPLKTLRLAAKVYITADNQFYALRNSDRFSHSRFLVRRRVRFIEELRELSSLLTYSNGPNKEAPSTVLNGESSRKLRDAEHT